MEEKAVLKQLIKLQANSARPPRPRHLKVIPERRRIWKSGSSTACQERQMRWSHHPLHTEKQLPCWEGSLQKYRTLIPSDT